MGGVKPTVVNPCVLCEFMEGDLRRASTTPVCTKDEAATYTVNFVTGDVKTYHSPCVDMRTTGPRGRAVWLRGVCDAIRVAFNTARNDNVSNNLEQVQVDATCTNISVVENDMECAATNKFAGASGATGRAYGNTGTASWPVGFTTGSSAL